LRDRKAATGFAREWYNSGMFAFYGYGPNELLVIGVVVALLIYGASKSPDDPRS
jgi:hypothetical protein